MIQFMFTTEDMTEEDIEYYHDTVISKEGMEAATIGEVCDLFSRFLAGMGYSEYLINKYIKSDDE